MDLLEDHTDIMGMVMKQAELTQDASGPYQVNLDIILSPEYTLRYVSKDFGGMS